MTNPRIVLRADGGATVGVGHLMRSITLGGAFVDTGFDVVLATRELPDALATRALDAGLVLDPLPVGDAADDAAWIRVLDPALVIADGYDLAPFVAACQSVGMVTGVVDDGARMGAGTPSLVIDGNLGSDPQRYTVAPSALMLVGAEYALVRHDLDVVRKQRRDRPAARNVLLAMGGADPKGASLPLLDAARGRSVDHVLLAVGPANSQRTALIARAQSSRHWIRVDRGDLVESYAEADVAVIAAGTTLWECATLGIPTIAVVVAENQTDGARAAQASGIAHVVEYDGVEDAQRVLDAAVSLLDDPAARAEMATVGPSIVDGRGATRVAHALQDWLGRTRA